MKRFLITLRTQVIPPEITDRARLSPTHNMYRLMLLFTGNSYQIARLRLSRRSFIYGCLLLAYDLHKVIGVPSYILDLCPSIFKSDFKFVDIPLFKVKSLYAFVKKLPFLSLFIARLRLSRRSFIYGCLLLAYDLHKVIGVPSYILDLCPSIFKSDFKFVDIPLFKVKSLYAFVKKLPSSLNSR